MKTKRKGRLKKAAAVLSAAMLCQLGAAAPIPLGEVAGAAPEVIYGDVNGDGIINVFDLITMKKSLMNTAVLNAEQSERADITGDGRVQTDDYVLLKDFLVKNIDSFPERPKVYNGIKTLSGKRQMEKLDRGVTAVRLGNNVFVSWRLLASDETDIGFNLYRVTDGKTVKLNDEALTKGTNFTDSTADLTKDNSYYVTTVYNGVETATDGIYTMLANKGSGSYITVPIKEGGNVHFVWVGDFNGDGAYDYLIDRNVDEHQKLGHISMTAHIFGLLIWAITAKTRIIYLRVHLR